jgi:hypothetical protein
MAYWYQVPEDRVAKRRRVKERKEARRTKRAERYAILELESDSCDPYQEELETQRRILEQTRDELLRCQMLARSLRIPVPPLTGVVVSVFRGQLEGGGRRLHTRLSDLVVDVQRMTRPVFSLKMSLALCS